MDRVRVGLSGLGAVFLLTLGVSLVFGRPDASPKVIESEKEPGEPLAQLGVAPGSEKPPQLVVPPAAPQGYQAPDAAEGEAPTSEHPVRTVPGEPAADVTIVI